MTTRDAHPRDRRGAHGSATEPGRLVGRGHPAGDFLEAWAWDVLEEDDGYLRVSAHLPDHVRNPQRAALRWVHPHLRRPHRAVHRPVAQRSGPTGLVTAGWRRPACRVDYFEPIVGPNFIIDSLREKQRGRTHHVLTRFLQDGELAVIAATTLREIAHESPSATRDLRGPRRRRSCGR